MIVKQVKFRSYPDVGNEEVFGGIAVCNDGAKPQYVICGCCGSIFEPDACEIVEVLKWLPISDEIMGDK